MCDPVLTSPDQAQVQCRITTQGSTDGATVSHAMHDSRESGAVTLFTTTGLCKPHEQEQPLQPSDRLPCLPCVTSATKLCHLITGCQKIAVGALKGHDMQLVEERGLHACLPHTLRVAPGHVWQRITTCMYVPSTKYMCGCTKPKDPSCKLSCTTHAWHLALSVPGTEARPSSDDGPTDGQSGTWSPLDIPQDITITCCVPRF